MLKFAALRPSQSLLFVLKFDLLHGNSHKSDNPEQPGVFAHLSDRHTHNNELRIQSGSSDDAFLLLYCAVILRFLMLNQ